MKVTNGTVWEAQSALQTVCKEPWPVKTAYRLAKLAKKVRDQYGVVQEVRNALITRHGETNEQGVPTISPQHPNWDAFLAEHNELMAQEWEVDGFEPIDLPESDIRVTPDVLLALDPFVTVT